MSMDDHESAASTDLGLSNKFLWVGKFANMGSINNEDWLYSYPHFTDAKAETQRGYGIIQ